MLQESWMNNNNKTLFYFSYASFLNDFSSDLLAGLLPYIIKTLGGNERDVTLIMGLRKSLSDLTTPFITRFSHFFKYDKILIISGYVISALSRLLILFSLLFFPSLFLVYFSVIVDRLAKGLRDPIRDNVIRKISKDKKGLFFGIHRAFDTLGALLGSLFGFVFHFLGLLGLLIISVVSGFLSFLPLLPLKKTLIINVKEKIKIEKYYVIALIPLFQINPGLPIAIFSTSLTEALFFYAIFNTFYIIFSPISGFLGDKSRKHALFLSIFSSFLSFLSFYFGNPLLGFVFYGLSYAFFESNGKAVFAKSKESLSISMFYFISGLASLISSFLAAFLITSLQSSDFFLFWALFHVFAIFIFKVINNSFL